MRRAFIVGCPRSGTTWTLLLAALHPEAVALQQTDVMRRLFYYSDWFETGHTYGRCALTVHPQEGIPASSGGLTRVGLERLLDPERLRELVRPLSDEVFEQALRTNPKASLVIEQTPEHIAVAEQILRIYPDAYFVHVVRDPRAVFASHRDSGWARPNSFSHDPILVAEEWIREVSRGRAIAGMTDRYMEVYYERLKTETDAELQRFYSFLELPSDTASRARVIEACGLDQLRKANLAPKGFFRRGEAAGWRDELSRSEVAVIEHMCGPLMTELGYEPTATLANAPLRLRLRQQRARMGEQLRRVANEGNGIASRLLTFGARFSPTLRRALRPRQ